MANSRTAALESTSLALGVLQTIGNLVVVMDRDGRVVLFNAACERLTGYQREEVEGRPVWDVFFLPRDRDGIAAAYERILDGNFRSEGEHYWLTRDGRQPLICWTYSTLLDADGQARYVIGSGDDVSQRRQDERDLAESLERMKAVLESSQDALLVLDHQARMVEWNPAAERMFGYSRDEVLGRRVVEIIPERLRGSYRQGLKVLQGGGRLPAVGRRQETVAVRRDGSEFPMELALSTWGQGDQLKILAAMRDLSERVEAESARQANEAKSRFLALMSHEFRTPLNSILGFAQLLGESPVKLTTRQERYVQYIISSGRHLLDLINDLLDMTKVQVGQMDIQRVEIDVNAALADVGTKIRPLAAAADLTLTIRPCPGVLARADRRRFDQVMFNLLANAIKFTPAGGSVDVRTELVGEQVEIAVADSGIGIPLAQQERVFQEFTQVDTETNRAQTGTGLGLALTQELVKAMGGGVRLTSVLGQGSTFTVWLPSAGGTSTG
jgi:protein-histidine pros-kinase